MKKLSLLILFLLTSLAGFSETKEAVVGDLKYSYDTDAGTAKVIRMNGGLNYSQLTAVVIPATVEIEGNNYNVTAIGQACFESSPELSSVTLPEGLITIEASAFSVCPKLQSIDFPSTLEVIGHQGFSQCDIRSVTIPASVRDLNVFTFFYNPNLQTIVVEAGNTVYDSRDNCNAIIITANNQLIQGSLSTVIPNTVTSMWSGFSHLNIESINIPASLVDFPTVGQFSGCEKLTTITVDAGNPVFESRENCIIEKATKTLYYGCKNSTIPDDIKIIRAQAFAGHPLTSITIPSSVTCIETCAFTGCQLETITLPENITELGLSVFTSNYNLTTIKSKIKNPFALSDDITTFKYYDNFRVDAEGNVTSDEHPIDVTLYVPEGTKLTYEATDGWKNFPKIVEDSELGSVLNTTIKGDNTVTVTGTETTSGIVEIPPTIGNKDVSEIGANALAGKTNVTDIYLPETDQALTLGSNALKIDDDHVATVHVPLSLLVDYALNEELKQNFEAGKVVATVTAPNQYWTFSSGVDVLVPDGVKVYICKAINGSDIQIVELTDAELTVDGKKVIKANNGVLISSTSGNAYDLVAKSGAQASGTIPAAFENANSYEGNKLVPVVRSENYDPDQYYMLYNGGFVKIADGDATKTPACRALLKK